MAGTRSQHYVAPADGRDGPNAIQPDLEETIQLDEAEENTFCTLNPIPTSIESQESPVIPLTLTPMTSSRVLTLKRKRSTAKAGRWGKR